MRTIVIFITVIVLIVAAGLADSEADNSKQAPVYGI